MANNQNLTYVQNLESADKQIYTGYVDSDNQPHGYGVMLYNDSSKYEGEWHRGLPNGRGKLTESNNDTYEGEWLMDKAHGFGKYTTTTKTYIGMWANDLYEGKGEEKFSDGSVFIGSFSKG